MEVLKVSSKSSPNSVAGAVAGVIRESGAVEVQAVGAGAANQAIKAIAIADVYKRQVLRLNLTDAPSADVSKSTAVTEESTSRK